MTIITLKQWRKIHKDYKSSDKNGGNKRILVLDKTGATVSTPIKIKEALHFN